METIYGKLNKQIESVYYTPINTDTATITIDKDLKTIKVDVNVDFILKDIKVDISNIETALSNKLDKLTTTQYPGLIVYSRDTEGNNVGINARPNIQYGGFNIIYRDANARAEIGTPIEPKQIANKEYVDNNLEQLTKVMPTDINVDSNNYLILEHDGTEITKQKKLVKMPVEKQRHFVTIKGTSDSTQTTGQSFIIKFDIYLDKGISLGTTLDSLTTILNNTSIATSGFITIDNVTSGVTELAIGAPVEEGVTNPKEYPILKYGVNNTSSEPLSRFTLTITDEIYDKSGDLLIWLKW